MSRPSNSHQLSEPIDTETGQLPDRHMNNTQLKWYAVAAWLAILAIAYATLARVGFVYDIYFKIAPFVMRPDMSAYAHFVHILAFMALGALFSFAYPQKTFLICLFVLGAAVLLEVLQTMTPDRHGTFIDAVEKMAGGALGILVPKAFAYWAKRRKMS